MHTRKPNISILYIAFTLKVVNAYLFFMQGNHSYDLPTMVNNMSKRNID